MQLGGINGGSVSVTTYSAFTLMVCIVVDWLYQCSPDCLRGSHYVAHITDMAYPKGLGANTFTRLQAVPVLPMIISTYQ